MKKKVAVIGEGLNDIQAFEMADVSFAMGSGKSVARNKASMVLLDDNFDSCVKAILRGRNIYANIKRFLQFQITVNFSVLVAIMLGVVYLTESPFNAIMLIWVNLVMDVLGALALATAPPLPNTIHEPAITHDTPILAKTVWRQIYGIALWNILIMTIFIFFGASMFGLEYNTSDTVSESLAKRQHYTIIFNTFIFLQFFNCINCRVVGPKDFNIFYGFLNNWVFVIIMAIVYIVQKMACQDGAFSLTWLFVTAPIENQTFYTCMMWGSTVIVISFLLKMTPAEWMEKVPIKIDENEAMGKESKIVGFYQAQKSAQGMPFKRITTTENDDDFVQP